MARLTSRSGLLLALIVSLGLAACLLGAPATVVAADPKLPAWDGGINLYRDGTFTTQRSWLWCTAADVQIIRNIVRGDDDHSTSSQRRYFGWMRDRNRYDLPTSAGVDPQGWTAGLREFVDDRYRLVASKSFDDALRSAVANLRRTNLPVAVTVAHGGHGWVLTGFTATADPLTSKSFKVTSVRIVGPLFGLQSRNGYDMRPNTKLTTAQFRRFFTPWHYDPKPMIWDGLYVSIQPIPAKPAPAATTKPVPPAPTASPTPIPTPSPTASPAPSPTLQPTASPGASPTALAVALAASPGIAPTPAPDGAQAVAAIAGPFLLVTIAALVVIAAVAGWQVGMRGRRPGR